MNVKANNNIPLSQQGLFNLDNKIKNASTVQKVGFIALGVISIPVLPIIGVTVGVVETIKALWHLNQARAHASRYTSINQALPEEERKPLNDRSEDSSLQEKSLKFKKTVTLYGEELNSLKEAKEKRKEAKNDFNTSKNSAIDCLTRVKAAAITAIPFFGIGLAKEYINQNISSELTKSQRESVNFHSNNNEELVNKEAHLNELLAGFSKIININFDPVEINLSDETLSLKLLNEVMKEYLKISNQIAEKTNVVNEDRMHEFIKKGRNIAQELARDKQPSSHTLEDATSLTWFLMSLAALKGEEHIAGVIRIEDEKQVIFNFLKSCQGNSHSDQPYMRISSHFPEITPIQTGLEIDSGLPGGKQSLLFAPLETASGTTTFLKIEDAGLPPLTSLKNVLRNVEHIKNYILIKTRGPSDDTNIAPHREQNKEERRLFNKIIDEIPMPTDEKKEVRKKRQTITNFNELLNPSSNNSFITTPPPKAEPLIQALKSKVSVITQKDEKWGYNNERKGNEVCLARLSFYFPSVKADSAPEA